MKQVTRLIGPRRMASSKPKEAPSYNAFASASTSSKKSQPASTAPAPLARVHNYGRVKSQPAGSSLPSSSAGKIQYAALNRMRKKRSEDEGKKLKRKSSGVNFLANVGGRRDDAKGAIRIIGAVRGKSQRKVIFSVIAAEGEPMDMVTIQRRKMTTSMPRWLPT